MIAAGQTSARSSQLDFEEYTPRSTAQDATAISRLADSYAELSGPVKLLCKEVENRRRNIRSLDLDDRTANKARSSAEDLLEELAADRGLGWSEIAKLCEVSVSAVRKWRAGESISPERRRLLARLAAFLDLLEEAGPVEEPAGWLNMRLVETHTVTAFDLYVDHHFENLLEYAQGHLNVYDLLARWNSDWRAAAHSDWAITDGPDGQRSLIQRV